MVVLRSSALELLLTEIVDSGPKLDVVVALAAAPEGREVTTRNLADALGVAVAELVDDLVALARTGLVCRLAGDDAGWLLDATSTWRATVASLAKLERAAVLDLMVRVAVDRTRHDRRDAPFVLGASPRPDATPPRSNLP